MIDFEIIPKRSLGPFQFEASIERYAMLYPYSFRKAEHEEDWDTYVFLMKKLIYIPNQVRIKLNQYRVLQIEYF